MQRGKPKKVHFKNFHSGAKFRFRCWLEKFLRFSIIFSQENKTLKSLNIHCGSFKKSFFKSKFRKKQD